MKRVHVAIYFEASEEIAEAFRQRFISEAQVLVEDIKAQGAKVENFKADVNVEE